MSIASRLTSSFRPSSGISRLGSYPPRQRLFPSASVHKSAVFRQDPKDIKITSNYKQPPVPKTPRGRTSQLPVYPIIAIFIAGTFLFYRLTKAREGVTKSKQTLPARDRTTVTKTKAES